MVPRDCDYRKRVEKLEELCAPLPIWPEDLVLMEHGGFLLEYIPSLEPIDYNKFHLVTAMVHIPEIEDAKTLSGRMPHFMKKSQYVCKREYRDVEKRIFYVIRVMEKKVA